HAISGFNMKGYGAMAGASVATPQGRGSELSALRRSVPTEAYSNLYKFDATAAADTYKEFTDINTNLGAVDTIGGGNASVASGRVADANVMGMRERIAHTSAIKAAADRTFGGDVDKMLNAEQDILRGKAAGGAAQIIGDGRKPLAVGVQAGQAEGIGLEASGDRVTVVGDDGAYSTELSKKLNEDAKMGVRRALDDIAQTGRITPETGAVLANIAGHPLGRAQLASQGIGDRIIKPGEEAENFANYLSGYGISVRPEDLAGATARMNMWTDTDGNLHPSLVATNKGVRVAEHNTGTKESDLNTEQAGRITGKEGATAGHYAIHFDPGTGEIVGIKGEGGFTASTGSVILSHDADGADRIQVIDPKTGKAVWTSAKLGEESIAKHDVKEEFGWSGQFGGHHFTSARRTDLGGGKVSIDGVTDEGKRITLVGSSRGDNEQVISMTQEQGPNYKGALAMAMRGNIPKEAMHDPLHRAVYANQFASEVSKFYQGTMDRKEINRLTKSWSAQGGVDIKIPGIASGGASFKGSDENVSQIESKSARDVMTQVTNIVLGSDSSDAQKQSAMQALADTVIHMNAEQAEGLEKAGTMVHREQHPTGVIRRDAPDSGFEEIKRPKMELP
ncbi:MAG: hypothetical protein JW920_12040, partial [Deltaproteobacteria bacterium]|nr:hypothetical protein [Deltaproteobacteria bacterium]